MFGVYSIRGSKSSKKGRKPILTIRSNGKVQLKKFVRNKKNSIIELYKQVKKSFFHTGKKKIGIFYGADIGPALDLEKMIKEDSKIKLVNVYFQCLHFPVHNFSQPQSKSKLIF